MKSSSLIFIAKKTGISPTNPFRIEKGEHHLTLDKLDSGLRKLKIKLAGAMKYAGQRSL